MNEQRPLVLPKKPGGEPLRIVARLVAMDGSEAFVPSRSVRYAGSHFMVAMGSPAKYVWLETEDVQVFHTRIVVDLRLRHL